MNSNQLTYSFEKIHPTAMDWKRIEEAYDSTCYQTEKWYTYLKRINVQPFVASIHVEKELIGYFLGEKTWLGISMITAPIEGIGTYTQGLNMLKHTSETERIHIYQELAKWIFSKRYALTFQVDDWQLRRDSAEWIPYETFHHDIIEQYGLHYEFRPTLYVPIGKSEDELWAGLSYSSCKYCINKATKLGLTVRKITDYNDIPTFCKVHYKQLQEVCKRKGQRPKLAQKEKRMRALCESLWPDRVLMLQCVGLDENKEEQVMSSGIFCLDKGQCTYWTGASFQRYQKYCPNELMVWEAMKYIHNYGGHELNFCGIADYKLKFGSIYAYVPRLKFAKYEILMNYSKCLKSLYHRIRGTKGARKK